MNPTKFDLIIIGSGRAGMAAAPIAVDAGWKVAVVDKLPFGGTCPLRGCDPKKLLRRGAEVIDAAQLMDGSGIEVGSLAINWADLEEHKEGFVRKQPAAMESWIEDIGATALHGTARFVTDTSIDVDGTTYESDHFLIASGMKPTRRDFPGADLMVDSAEFMNLTELPEHIVFIGGGMVSFEFAHIAARAGATAVILNHSERPLKAFDPDLVDRLVATGTESGVSYVPSTDVVSVTTNDAGGFTLTTTSGGVETTLHTELVVNGTGRVADIDDLNLAGVGVETKRGGVVVDEYFQTTNSRIWAAGDVAASGGEALTPISSMEGRIAATNMTAGPGEPRTTADYRGIPSGVFSVPELVRVGLLEAQARDAGMDVEVKYTDTSAWFSQYRIGAKNSAVKVIINRADDTIVGAHLFGHDYGELANMFAIAIQNGLTATQLRDTTMLYPSVGSDLASML